MATRFKKGSKVQWKWLGRTIEGKVEEVFLEPVVKTIKGKRIKRNGSSEKPAYLVRSKADNLALKLESELQKYKKIESAWDDSKED
jgi:Hypervirulence associated proteins TUDOR domain